MSHRFYACTTCVRDHALAPGETSRGAQVAEAVESVFAERGLDATFNFLRVPCLNGCPSPCNVSLRAPRKWALRFSRMTPEDAPALCEVAARFHASGTGDPDTLHLPDSLREGLTVRTPPPHLLFAASGD